MDAQTPFQQDPPSSTDTTDTTNTTDTQQPIAPPLSDTSTQGQGGNPEETEENKFLSFTVIAIDKAKKDTFKFEVATDLPHFQRTKYVKERTYSEFERLRAHFVTSYPEIIPPPLPSQFSHALTAEENERRVRASMTTFLSRVAESKILRKDEGLRAFVESEFPFNPVSVSKKSAGGFRAKMARMVAPSSSSGSSSPRSSSSSMSGSSTLAERDDPTYEAIRKAAQYNESLGAACGKAVSNEVKARKGLSFCYVDIAAKVISMGGVEQNPSWANGLRKFGKCLQTVSELELDQASSENAILGDLFDIHVKSTKAVQEGVAGRSALRTEHESMLRSTEKKKKELEKMKMSSAIRSERVNDALEDLEESKKGELQSAAHVDRVSKSLKSEMETTYARNRMEILSALAEHSLRAVEHERAQLRVWQSCIPEISKVISETAVVGERVNARDVAERLAGAFL